MREIILVKISLATISLKICDFHFSVLSRFESKLEAKYFFRILIRKMVIFIIESNKVSPKQSRSENVSKRN